VYATSPCTATGPMSPAVSAPKTMSETYFAADADTSKPPVFACARATPPWAQPFF